MNTAQGLNTLGPFANNGSLPNRGIGRLPGPLRDQLWRNLKNAETPAMVFYRRGIPTALVFDHCIIIEARDEG